MTLDADARKRLETLAEAWKNADGWSTFGRKEISAAIFALLSELDRLDAWKDVPPFEHGGRP